jgi:heme/copper-type cytochrome/quinol oxidase subunit 2
MIEKDLLNSIFLSILANIFLFFTWLIAGTIIYFIYKARYDETKTSL